SAGRIGNRWCSRVAMRVQIYEPGCRNESFSVNDARLVSTVEPADCHDAIVLDCQIGDLSDRAAAVVDAGSPHNVVRVDRRRAITYAVDQAHRKKKGQRVAPKLSLSFTPFQTRFAELKGSWARP